MSQKKTKQNKQTGTLEGSSFNPGDLQFTAHSTPREGIRSTILHLRTERKCRPTHIPWVQQEIRKGWRETLRTHHAGGSTPVVCISALSSFQIGTVILVTGEAQFNHRAPDPHLARDGAKSSDTGSEHKTSAPAAISPPSASFLLKHVQLSSAPLQLWLPTTHAIQRNLGEVEYDGRDRSRSITSILEKFSQYLLTARHCSRFSLGFNRE